MRSGVVLALGLPVRAGEQPDAAAARQRVDLAGDGRRIGDRCRARHDPAGGQTQTLAVVVVRRHRRLRDVDRVAGLGVGPQLLVAAAASPRPAAGRRSGAAPLPRTRTTTTANTAWPSIGDGARLVTASASTTAPAATSTASSGIDEQDEPFGRRVQLARRGHHHRQPGDHEHAEHAPVGPPQVHHADDGDRCQQPDQRVVAGQHPEQRRERGTPALEPCVVRGRDGQEGVGPERPQVGVAVEVAVEQRVDRDPADEPARPLRRRCGGCEPSPGPAAPATPGRAPRRPARRSRRGSRTRRALRRWPGACTTAGRSGAATCSTRRAGSAGPPGRRSSTA